MGKKIYGILGAIIVLLAIVAVIVVNCDGNKGPKMTEVTLYYVNSENISLYKTGGVVEGDVTAESLFQTLMMSLPESPNADLLIPEGTVVLGSEVNEEGQMVLNLSGEFAPGLDAGGSYGKDVDTLIIMSIVNTMVDNLEDVSSVKIIVDGVEVPMYKRSIYLNVYFKKDQLLK